MPTLFPRFTEFVAHSKLQERAKGNLSAALPRVLGQGTTKATGLTLPPSAIERKAELASLAFPDSSQLPSDVREEIDAARADVERRKAELARADGQRVFAASGIQAASPTHAFKDGYYCAGELILIARKNGFEWAWSITPHYTIVDRIPPDLEYVVHAFAAAKAKIASLTVPTHEFGRRLRIAWQLAREFSDSDETVLVTDVMKMYQVAGQDAGFWKSPRRAAYKDLPDAAFAVNLIAWRRAAEDNSGFEFVPALFSQTKGSTPEVFYLPMNAEGTEVRPMKFLRRSGR